MRFWVLSAKVLLAVGSVAVGLAIYLMSPSAQMVPYGYWTAILVYVVAIEVAWYLAELQTSRRPRQLSRAGLQALHRRAFRATARPVISAAVWRDPVAEIGADRDIERDIQPAMISSLTTAGSDNRFELIVAAPGAGKSTFLYRLGLELLKRSYLVCTLSGKLPEKGPDLASLRALARQTSRLFVLVDDIELRVGTGSLLALVLGRSDGITVVGTCSQQAYEMILRGGRGGIGARDLISLGTLHHLRLTPRETQMLYDRAMREHTAGSEAAMMARQTVMGSVKDLLSLNVTLQHGWRMSTLVLSALDELDEAQKTVLYGLSMASLEGGWIPQAQLQTLSEGALSDCLDAIAETGLAVRRDGRVCGPHPALALMLLRTPELLGDEERLDVAERMMRGLVGSDMLRADAIMRALLYGATDLGTRLWSRCSDLWIAAADNSTAAELVGLVVPTLCLAGDYRLAADLCRRQLDHPLLGERASFQRGLCLHQMGRYSAAEEIFTGLLSSDSYAQAARLNCALTSVGQGRYGEGEKHLRVLEHTDPRLPGLHHLLGYAAEVGGDLDTAMEEYREARAQYWFDNVALRRLAALKIATGASKEAIRLFEAGLQQEPDHVDHYGGLAVAHYLDGNTSRAAVQSARAIQTGLDPAVVRKAVARAYIERGLYDQALNELNNCLVYVPDDVETHLLIGHCLHSRNDPEGAREALEKAVALDPQSAMAKQQLAGYLRDLQQYDRASTLINQIVSVQTPTPELALLSAMIAASQGDNQRCAQQAALALEAGDESGWAWFLSARAVGEGQAGDSYDKAAKLLAQTAVTGSRVESASAHQAVAVCRRQLGDPTGATGSARRARNRIVNEQYADEPVFSALLLRHIPGPEFLRELSGLEYDSGGDGEGP